MEVVGMTNRFYVVEKYSGSNCSFIPCKDIGEKHTIYGFVGKDRVSITLEQHECICSSGWCTANIASIDVKHRLPNFPPMAYIPSKKPLTIDIDEIDDDDDDDDDVNIDCEAFVFSATGGDKYYPSGFYDINYDVFEKTPRYVGNRIVYVFTGPSGIGKSFLASHLDRDELNVLETDKNPVLPDIIYDDVVVVGNKYGHCIDDITPRLFREPIVRLCQFS